MWLSWVLAVIWRWGGLVATSSVLCSLTPGALPLFDAVALEGYYKDQLFDQRELRFEVGEGESLDLPCGLESAIQRMEKGERSIVYLKPR